MLCSNCKKEIPDDSRFCPECRKKLDLIDEDSTPGYDEKGYGFNIFAFLFGVLWYFWNGMFVKGIILTAVMAITGFALGGGASFLLVAIVFAFYCAFKGEKDYHDHVRGGSEIIIKGVTKKCPYCAEVIKAEAKVCKYCIKEQN